MKNQITKNKLLILVFIIITLCSFAYAADIRHYYDPLNRLIKTDYSNGITVQYTYDETGNRQTKATTQSPGGYTIFS